MSGRPVELLRALAVLGEPPKPEHARVAQALGLTEAATNSEYADVFLFQLYPYASVYLGEEGMMGGDACDRVAGFWTALGRVPPSEPDHLSALIALYADLVDDQVSGAGPEGALHQEAARALLHEHLSPWVFAYLARLAELGSGFYAAWGALLEEALRDEQAAAPGPTLLPVHLRSVNGITDPRDGGGAGFVTSLLAPARAGMIITRADLARLSSSLDLGLRAGERRYALEHLLSVDPEGVLRWLAQEAKRQAEGHGARVGLLGLTASFSQERALETAALCESLAQDTAVLEGSAPAGAPEAVAEGTPS
jgi:TorA maturation chaperone TorD